jgi:hypothetical protein
MPSLPKMDRAIRRDLRLPCSPHEPHSLHWRPVSPWALASHRGVPRRISPNLNDLWRLIPHSVNRSPQ